jgi:hypothetical protein
MCTGERRAWRDGRQRATLARGQGDDSAQVYDKRRVTMDSERMWRERRVEDKGIVVILKNYWLEKYKKMMWMTYRGNELQPVA